MIRISAKLILISSFILFSCNQDDKIALELVEDIDYGAIIRTVSIQNGEFEVNQPNSEFNITIEEQDEEEGGLFQNIEVFTTFVDNTPENGDLSTAEVFLETLEPDTFSPAPTTERLPRRDLSYTFERLAQANGVPIANVSCKDQFILRMVINLTDGRSFTKGTASSIIIAFDTFFSSPYEYTINVVEPIKATTFTGTYRYESILDGPSGPTFGEPQEVEVVQGHSNNVRTVALKHIRSHPTNELPRNYEFSIVCDETVFQKNQLSSVIAYCSFSGAPILLGPDTENAPVNPNDDSVFELWFVEGYDGWDGDCGFGTVPSRIRFTKQ